MTVHACLRRAAVAAVLGCSCALPAVAQPPEALAASAGASATVLPPTLPVRRDAGPARGAGGWWPGVAGLGLVAALAAWFAWRRGGLAAVKASGPRAQASVAERVSSHALTPQASVHVVRWHGEELLLGCTSQQVTLLCRRPPAPQPGAAP